MKNINKTYIMQMGMYIWCYQNWIVINVGVNVKTIEYEKKIIVGILAHIVLKMVSI